MIDYKKLYIMLFNCITDAIELRDRLEILAAKEILISVQQKAETEHIEAE